MLDILPEATPTAFTTAGTISKLAQTRSKAAIDLKKMVLDTIVGAGGSTFSFKDTSSTAKVCEGAAFGTSPERYLDRNEQLSEIDTCLSMRVTKKLRTLNVTIASPGMGKSRLLDTYAGLLVKKLEPRAQNQLVPVLVSFNTNKFGDSCHPASAAVTLGARVLVSALSPDPSQELVEVVMEELREIAAIHRLVELTLFDLCVEVALQLLQKKLDLAYLPRMLLGIDEVSKAELSVPGMSERIINLATKYLDWSSFENSLEYKSNPSQWDNLSDSLPDKFSLLVTGLELDLFSRTTEGSGRDIVRIGLPQLSHKSCVQLITEQYAGNRITPTEVANLAVISAGHPRTIEVLGKAVQNCPGKGRLTASDVVKQALKSVSLKKSLDHNQIIFALLHNEMSIANASSDPMVVQNIRSGNFHTSYFGDDTLRITLPPLVLHYSLQQSVNSDSLPTDTLRLLNDLLLVDPDHPFGEARFSTYLQYGRYNRDNNGNLYVDFHLCAMLVRKQLLRRYRNVDHIAQTDGHLYGEPLAKVGDLSTAECSLDPYARGREPKVVVLSDTKVQFPNAVQINELLEILKKKCAGSRADSIKIQHVMENRNDKSLLLALLYELTVVVVPGFTMQKGFDFFTVEKSVAPFLDQEGNNQMYFIRAVEPSFQTSTVVQHAMTEEQVLKMLNTKFNFVFKEAEWHLMGVSAGQVMHELIFYGVFPSSLNTARLTQYLVDSPADNAMVVTTPALRKAYGGLYPICTYFHKNKPQHVV